MSERPITLSDHAREEAARRGIAEDHVLAVARHPDQREEVRPGREVLQSPFESDGKRYLLRVFVDREDDEDVIVTVYRTSKLEKYWRRP